MNRELIDRTVFVDLETRSFSLIARVRIEPRQIGPSTFKLPDVIEYRGTLYRLHEALSEHPWLVSPIPAMPADRMSGRRTLYVEADVFHYLDCDRGGAAV